MLKKYWIIIAVTAAIVITAFLISMFCFQLMLVHGDSMSPALKNMHLALIDKRSENYRAGDIIVFRCDGLKSMLVKRVAGCPGDSVRIQDGKLYVNGSESPLYKNAVIEYPGLLASETVLGDDEFAVLGDNLAESRDSRNEEIGIIHRQDITGKVIM